MAEFNSIKKVHDAYDAKKLSPVELTKEYLKAIKASDHNAYLTVCEERALKQADSAAKILKSEGKVPREKYPLLGVPMGIKDVLTVEGVRTTCASRMLENYIPP